MLFSGENCVGNILYGDGAEPPVGTGEVPMGGDQADLMGWGTVIDGSGSNHVDTPRTARATIMDYDECEAYYFGLDDNQICLDTSDSKPGPCTVSCQLLHQAHIQKGKDRLSLCLLYTSPSPRDRQKSRMPSSA